MRICPAAPACWRILPKRLGEPDLRDNRVVFHYLDGKVDAEIYLSADQQPAEQADDIAGALQ